MTKLFIASRRVVSTNSTTPPPPPKKKKKKGKYDTKSLSCLHGYMSTTRLSQFRLYFITNKHEFQRFELTYISVCNLNFNRLNQKFWLNGERLQLSQAMRADLTSFHKWCAQTAITQTFWKASAKIKTFWSLLACIVSVSLGFCAFFLPFERAEIGTRENIRAVKKRQRKQNPTETLATHASSLCDCFSADLYALFCMR